MIIIFILSLYFVLQGNAGKKTTSLSSDNNNKRTGLCVSRFTLFLSLMSPDGRK